MLTGSAYLPSVYLVFLFTVSSIDYPYLATALIPVSFPSLLNKPLPFYVLVLFIFFDFFNMFIIINIESLKIIKKNVTQITLKTIY